MTWRPMAMPVMRHGSRTGVLPAATSSSCWAAGMRRRDASYAWRPSMTTARIAAVADAG